MEIDKNSTVNPANPKVALVLGGGGLKPISAIPLIDFLLQSRIVPGLLAGCSGGAGMMALMASGYSTQEMIELFRKTLNPRLFKKNWKSLAAMFGLARVDFGREFSFFKPEPIQKMFRRTYGDRTFQDLKYPLVLQTTDYETGEPVEVETGDLASAVYASSAVIPFFPPILVNGRVLFDGVYSSPLPIFAALKRGADIIIAVDFMEDLQPHPANFYEAMVHVNKVYARTISRSQTSFSIDLHHYEIVCVKVRFEKYVQLWHIDSFDLILEAGKKAVAKYGKEILTVYQSFRHQDGLAPDGAGAPHEPSH